MEDAIEILEKLSLIHARLSAALPSIGRPYIPSSEAERAILLQGPRGVGKTCFLLRSARGSHSAYFSADHPLLSDRGLYEWIEILFSRGVERVYIDEVHQARDWSVSLKTLYDDYPGKRIWVSGSSSLLLEEGISDLSRRYVGQRMPFLSFREYLVLMGECDFGQHDPFARDQSWVKSILEKVNVLARFEEYLDYGTRPIFLEGQGSYGIKVLQTIQKTLESDVPQLVITLQASHIRLMSAMLGYLAQAPIPTLSVNSLCREWGVGKEKLYQLLQAMEKTGVLNVVRKASDHAASSIGAKVFFADPTLYSVLAGKKGNAREAFVVSALRDGGREVLAASDEKEADFIVDGKLSIEIGGARKNRKKAELVIRDGADWPAPGIVALWMLGFMH